LDEFRRAHAIHLHRVRPPRPPVLQHRPVQPLRSLGLAAGRWIRRAAPLRISAPRTFRPRQLSGPPLNIRGAGRSTRTAALRFSHLRKRKYLLTFSFDTSQ
jgi:hypothetical protein